jgi:FixJ family two-component response regulator
MKIVRDIVTRHAKFTLTFQTETVEAHSIASASPRAAQVHAVLSQAVAELVTILTTADPIVP